MMQSPADGSVIIEETAGQPSGDNSLFLPLSTSYSIRPTAVMPKLRIAQGFKRLWAQKQI